MRLYINHNTFISVLPLTEEVEEGYSCQVMNLLNGIGLYPLNQGDDLKKAVSVINHDYKRKEFKTIKEIFEYHQEIMFQII